jgi:hypothetical protein
MLWVVTAPGVSASYSCGDSMMGHCYGVNQYRLTYIGGFSTQISSQLLHTGADGFVDNEMWLADDLSDPCISIRYRACWVEAGIISPVRYNDTGGTYFWAENAPGRGFAYHLVGDVPASQFGFPTTYTIVRGSEVRGRSVAIPAGVTPSDSTYFIYISHADPSGGGTLFVGVSASNAMIPVRVDMGQELAGRSSSAETSAAAPSTMFSFNQGFIRGSVGYRTLSGRLVTQMPPFASWSVPPESSSTGGAFVTRCC